MRRISKGGFVWLVVGLVVVCGGCLPGGREEDEQVAEANREESKLERQAVDPAQESSKTEVPAFTVFETEEFTPFNWLAKVRIKEPVTEAQVKEIAISAFRRERANYKRSSAWLFLEGDSLEIGWWASAINDDGEWSIQIGGPSKEELEALELLRFQATEGQVVVGEWVCRSLGHIITIVKSEDSSFVRNTFVDGTWLDRDTRQISANPLRYSMEGGEDGREYYQIEADGRLTEVIDGNKIYTIQPLNSSN